MNCVLCEEPTTSRFEKRGFDIVECVACGHMFSNPGYGKGHTDTVYGDEYFFGGADGYPNYLEEAPLLKDRGKYYAGKLSAHMKPGYLLDVGCAAGFVLQGFMEKGWQGVGIDPNPGMVEYGRRHLKLDLEVGILETYDHERQFDLVSLIQVIAHLQDLGAALESAANLTRPGGYLLVETWNQQSLTARILGRYWHEYSPPSVLHWFSPNRLSDLLRKHGFEHITFGRTLKRISLAHAAALAGHAVGLKSLEKWKDRLPPLTVPYPSEDLFWGLYRRLP